MAKHIGTGREGELLARQYFISKNYTVLHCNWRFRHWEVDIIAAKNNVLHFIEVKTRRSESFGYPEENVDHAKIRSLINAADEFLCQFPEWKRIQFDVLAISINGTGAPGYFLIEDVYL